jgi:hypothetical protein
MWSFGTTELPMLLENGITDTNMRTLVIMMILMFSLNFQCRNVVWLPGSVSEASVTNQACRICTPGHL